MIHNLPAIVTATISASAGLPEIEIQQALNKAFPYNKGNVEMWHKYGKEIWVQSGRAM